MRRSWSAPATALSAAADGASPGEISADIQDREHDADDIIRDVLTEVRRTFLTPFDRGAITALIGAMDDAIDEMLAAARAIDLYELRDLRSRNEARSSRLIVEAAQVTARGRAAPSKCELAMATSFTS